MPNLFQPRRVPAIRSTPVLLIMDLAIGVRADMLPGVPCATWRARFDTLPGGYPLGRHTGVPVYGVSDFPKGR